MLFYGEVWRQPTVPLLWISGIHRPDQLLIRDLSGANSEAPILSLGPCNVELNVRFENYINDHIEPLEYDTDDEEDDGEWELDGDNASSHLSAGDDDLSSVETPAPDDEEFEENFAMREYERELKVGKMDGCIVQLERVLEAPNDAKMYAIMHPHIHEISEPTFDNIVALKDWADRWHALQNERQGSAIWSQRRRGNMFV
jgi:hypothetical protein